LTLALMLNPEAQQSSKSAMRSRPFQGRATGRSRPALRPTSKRVAIAGTAQVGLHVGALPRLGLDISLGITGGIGRGSVWMLGSYAPSQEELAQGDARRGGRLSMMTGAALGCWRLTREAPSLGPCLGAAFNRIRGRGIHVDHPRSGTVYWVSPTAALLTDVPLGPWVAVRAAALGQVALARPATYLEGIGPVHRPSRAEARLLAGLLIGPR
jgi:hypothetical protein